MARDRARRRPRLAHRPRDGNAERAPVPGLARRLPAHRPARLLQLLRSLHPHHRFHVQPARQVAEGVREHSVAAAHRVAELPAHLARLAPGPQRFQPSGPGLSRSRGQQEGGDHPRLPAAGCQLPAARHRPVPAQPEQGERHRRGQAAAAAVARPWMQAITHCTLGIGIWRWASSDHGGECDVVLGCCGDVPTLETLAAVGPAARRSCPICACA